MNPQERLAALDHLESIRQSYYHFHRRSQPFQKPSAITTMSFQRPTATAAATSTTTLAADGTLIHSDQADTYHFLMSIQTIFNNNGPLNHHHGRDDDNTPSPGTPGLSELSHFSDPSSLSTTVLQYPETTCVKQEMEMYSNQQHQSTTRTDSESCDSPTSEQDSYMDSSYSSVSSCSPPPTTSSSPRKSRSSSTITSATATATKPHHLHRRRKKCTKSLDEEEDNTSSNDTKPPKKVRKINPNLHCVNCLSSKTSVWRRDPLNNVICNACSLYLKAHGTNRPAEFPFRKAEVKRRNR
ncbi:hypothetical protein BDR26DRAFT_859708 [Obelidium mucronatum]|nr:hypothetical protein BDR26DRAFT_859708 [Obelidium mucronatum]